MEPLTKLEHKIINIGLRCDSFNYKDLETLASKCSERTVYQCCEYLNNKGFFSHYVIDDDGVPHSISINYQLRAYFEYQRIDKIEFFKRSFLCPVIVSTCTTLIVLFLKWLISTVLM